MEKIKIKKAPILQIVLNIGMQIKNKELLFSTHHWLERRHVTASDEFKEIERMRSKARHDEAQALYSAEMRGEERANTKWQGVATENMQLSTENEELRLQLAKK